MFILFDRVMDRTLSIGFAFSGKPLGSFYTPIDKHIVSNNIDRCVFVKSLSWFSLIAISLIGSNSIDAHCWSEIIIDFCLS